MSGLGTPTCTTVPARSRAKKACSQHLGVADGLDADVGAEAVGERLDGLDRVAPSPALTVWVAPKPLAHSSFAASRSTAMIVRAPARRAPAMAASPTPPQPNTATESPRLHVAGVHRGTEAGHDAAAEQPGGLGAGPGSTCAHWPAATSVFSAKAPMPSAGESAVPSRVIFWVALCEAKQYQGLAPAAGAALAARRPPGEDHEVAGRDVGDARHRRPRRRRPPRGRAGTGTRR